MSEFKLEEQSRRITLADWWDQFDIDWDHGLGAHALRVGVGIAVMSFIAAVVAALIWTVGNAVWMVILLMGVTVAWLIGWTLEDW